MTPRTRSPRAFSCALLLATCVGATAWPRTAGAQEAAGAAAGAQEAAASPAVGAREAAESERISRLRAAAARYPEDPDLAWALAVALAREWHPDAVSHLRAYEQRWPERRPETGVYLGRILYRSNDLDDALAALDRALARDASQAPGHLYRGLVLKRMGRLEEADAALARAARLSPALRRDVSRLRGRLFPRRRAAAKPRPPALVLIERVAIDEVEPRPDVERGEHGEQRRSFAAGRSAPRTSVRTFLAAGFDWDSNPERESSHGLDGPESDLRGTWQGGVSYHPRLNERVRLGAGYQYRGWRHLDTREEDRQRHEAFASGSLQLGEGVSARLLGAADYDQREGDAYRWLFYARPSLSWKPGAKLGTGELYGAIEYADFVDDPSRDSLVLDGFEWGVGYRHRFLIPGWSRARATLGLEHSWLRTDAGRDSRGFSSAFDNRELEGRLSIEMWLPGRLRAELAGAIGGSWHRHRNAVDALLGGRGRHRRDAWLSWRLGLRRSLSRLVDVELSYRGLDSDSNVRFYDYGRHVLALELGVVWDMGRSWPWKTEDR